MDITPKELETKVDNLILDAFEQVKIHGVDFGAVNWGDIAVRDIVLRGSMLHPTETPEIVVVIEEAAPNCRLAEWLTKELDMAHVTVEAEW